MAKHSASFHRELAFALLYTWSFHSDASIESIAATAHEAACEAFLPTPQAVQLAELAVAHQAELDTCIAERLKGWRFERVERASLAILRLALVELLCTSVPVGTSINEAVELAKRYGSDGAPRFINGVLRAVAREREAAHADTRD